MEIRVGIIGAGSIAGTHARILAQNKRVRFSSVFDVVRERAGAFAETIGGQAAGSPEAVFEASDAVYITTPNAAHQDLAIAALERGIHVFSEKPMATSLNGARALLEAAERSRALYQIGHNRRFADVYKCTRRLLKEGAVAAYSVHIKMNRGELKKPHWVADPKKTGGFLYETPIHLLDMARWLFGDVDSLTCLARSNVYHELDDFSILMTFVDGAHATFTSSAHASWLFPFERIEIFGDHTTIETMEMDKVRYSPGNEQESLMYDFTQKHWENRWGYVEENQRFIDAIVSGGQTPVTALDGYKSIELVEACYRSARQGERITLPLTP
ncbi:MAG: Gfo/Idh/MocA family oxidoreductase [Acidobacteria bacterium]|nr:Gfo/Idh/MocA family oxidoreductase [Acidobacteriota bacterium]MBI3658625.1 Gfo/Idh/MocA family oxidoreductase [Acidobacteriota bacterium]